MEPHILRAPERPSDKYPEGRSGYRIGQDGVNSYTLEEGTFAGKKAKDAGALRWKVKGYYARLPHVARAACDVLTLASDRPLVEAVHRAVKVVDTATEAFRTATDHRFEEKEA